MTTKTRCRPPTAEAGSDFWELRLYIAGHTANTTRALANLEEICRDRLADKYRIEVVDLLESPQLAAGDQIVAIPTLVRRLPSPLRKIIGDLSNTQRVLVGLQIVPSASAEP